MITQLSYLFFLLLNSYLCFIMVYLSLSELILIHFPCLVAHFGKLREKSVICTIVFQIFEQF